MKILLVNDKGQTVAQVSDVERYDGSLAGHTAGLLDLLEVLIASSKSSGTTSAGGPAALAETWASGKQACETPR